MNQEYWYMSKDESLMLKGIAILMMIFLHLFNQIDNVALCSPIIFIGEEPLVYILRKACNPVPVFMILSGYGMYLVTIKGDNHRWTRLLKLMIHYWIITLIFVGIGHSIDPERYPGNYTNIVQNITGYQTTYNDEMWFLMPFILVSIATPLIINVLNRNKWYYNIMFALILYFAAAKCEGLFGSFLRNNHGLLILLNSLILLFNFVLGVEAARHKFFTRLKAKLQSVSHIRIYTFFVIIGLILFQFVFSYNVFYSFCLIAGILMLQIGQSFKNILVRLGNNSMNMWMIHTYFCYYMFKDFIYGFEYPIIIFIVLTAISYISSIIINQLTAPIGYLVTRCMPAK